MILESRQKAALDAAGEVILELQAQGINLSLTWGSSTVSEATALMATVVEKQSGTHRAKSRFGRTMGEAAQTALNALEQDEDDRDRFRNLVSDYATGQEP